MGKHFGNLQYLKGVTYYMLSPYELKTFKGMFNPGILNVIRRVGETFPYILPPVMLLIAIRTYGLEANKNAFRKNPDDYVCDV